MTLFFILFFDSFLVLDFNSFVLIQLFLSFRHVTFFFVINKRRQMWRENLARGIFHNGKHDRVVHTITDPLGLYIFFIFQKLDLRGFSVSYNVSGLLHLSDYWTTHTQDTELHGINRTFSGNVKTESFEKKAYGIILALELIWNSVLLTDDSFFIVTYFFCH